MHTNSYCFEKLFSLCGGGGHRSVNDRFTDSFCVLYTLGDPKLFYQYPLIMDVAPLKLGEEGSKVRT